MTTCHSKGYKKRRGLAAVSPERRREIARKGNKALRAQGKVNTFTSETGKAAALKRERIVDE